VPARRLPRITALTAGLVGAGYGSRPLVRCLSGSAMVHGHQPGH
jgi:hypothetical protein